MAIYVKTIRTKELSLIEKCSHNSMTNSTASKNILQTCTVALDLSGGFHLALETL